MSSEVLLLLAMIGVGFALAAFVVGLKALRLSKTVVPGEAKPQQFMIQVEPPSDKVQAINLPRRATDAGASREKQA